MSSQKLLVLKCEPLSASCGPIRPSPWTSCTVDSHRVRQRYVAPWAAARVKISTTENHGRCFGKPHCGCQIRNCLTSIKSRRCLCSADAVDHDTHICLRSCHKVSTTCCAPYGKRLWHSHSSLFLSHTLSLFGSQPRCQIP